jgi:CP family cyanate transporter-like MFS transporter
MSAVGLIVIGIFPDFLPLVWAVVAGLGLGAAFSLGLSLLSEYGETPQASARLSALAFLVSYLCSAAGPVIMGWFIGQTGSWIGLYIVLVAICGAQALLAWPLRRGIRIS